MSDVVPYEIVEVAATGPQAEFSAALPAALGVASAGSSTAAARADHVHPPTTDMVPAVVGAGVMQRARAWCDTADLTLTGPDGRSPRHRGYLPDRSGHGMHAWFGSTRPSGVIGRSTSGVACLQPTSTVRAKAAVPVQAPTELDVRTVFRAADFTPSGAAQFLIGRGLGTSNQFAVYLNTDGTISLAVFTDGTTARWSSSGSAPTATDGVTVLAHRVTWRASDGRVQHWTKVTTEDAAHVAIDDDTGWTQLGSNLTSSAVTALYPTSDQLEVGAIAGAYPLVGNIYAASYRTAIGGTIVAKLDPTNYAGEGAWVDPYGIAWSITPDGVDTNDPLAAVPLATGPYVQGSATAGNYLGATYSGSVSAETTELSCRVQWRPSGTVAIMGFEGQFDLLSISGSLHGGLPFSGTWLWPNFGQLPLRDGEWCWLRLRRTRSTGVVAAWWAADQPTEPAAWNTLTPVTYDAGVDLTASTALRLGMRSGASNSDAGFAAAYWRKDGSTVASVDPSRATSPFTSVTDAQSNTWTLNRGSIGSKQLSIVERPKLIHGVTHLAVNDYGLLNPGLGSFTFCWAGRIFGPSSGWNVIAGKPSLAGGQASYALRRSPTYTSRVYAEIHDGTNTQSSHTATGADYTSGQAALYSLIVDRNAQTIRHAVNGTLSATASIAAVGAVNCPNPLHVAAERPGVQGNSQEDLGLAVFGEALSSAELLAVASQFGVL